MRAQNRAFIESALDARIGRVPPCACPATILRPDNPGIAPRLTSRPLHRGSRTGWVSDPAAEQQRLLKQPLLLEALIGYF